MLKDCFTLFNLIMIKGHVKKPILPLKTSNIISIIEDKIIILLCECVRILDLF
jgi:hypothetical protein